MLPRGVSFSIANNPSYHITFHISSIIQIISSHHCTE